MLFDTSALTTTSIVVSGVASLRGTTQTDALGATPNINVYGSTPASNTSLVGADYGQIGSTAYATAITYAGWSTSGYNDFTLNATGVAAISKTAVTKFGARNANYDVAAVEPGGSGSSALGFFTAARTGTSSDPKLTVTYNRLRNQAVIIG